MSLYHPLPWPIFGATGTGSLPIVLELPPHWECPVSDRGASTVAAGEQSFQLVNLLAAFSSSPIESRTLDALLRASELAAFAIEAIHHLHFYMLDFRVKVRAVNDTDNADVESDVLVLDVLTALDVAEARSALRAFDEAWFLPNWSRCEGRVVVALNFV